MSCSDDLKNIDWNIPQMPCDDVGNMDRWKSYSDAMDAWSKKGDLKRVTKQCICQNGSTCYAKEKCSNDLFSNVGSALSNPDCVTCITQSPECKPFALGLSKLGIILKNSQPGNVTPTQVGTMVQQMCNVNVDSTVSEQIANVLNGTVQPTPDDSSSPTWVKPQTWMIIGAVAFVLFLSGVWMYSRRSKVSRHVSHK